MLSSAHLEADHAPGHAVAITTISGVAVKAFHRVLDRGAEKSRRVDRPARRDAASLDTAEQRILRARLQRGEAHAGARQRLGIQRGEPGLVARKLRAQIALELAREI